MFDITNLMYSEDHMCSPQFGSSKIRVWGENKQIVAQSIMALHLLLFLAIFSWTLADVSAQFEANVYKYTGCIDDCSNSECPSGESRLRNTRIKEVF